jgi:predicted ATPase
MRCLKCGSDNQAGKKFCGDCGASLTNRCPNCGAENPPGKRFCGDCGTPLGSRNTTAQSPSSSLGTVEIAISAEATPPADGERKTVTALFADIKGSTELMEDLDPEEARVIIDPALKLFAVKGYAAPEANRAYTRARDLCARLGDPREELFSALYGLWAAHLMRGELRKCYQLGEQLLRRAESARDAALLLYARYALGTTSNMMGEFVSAREHLEIAIALYDPDRHRALTSRYEGVDAGVSNLSLGAFVLWQLGYPGQALKRSNEARALAERLSHPQSLSRAGMMAGVFHLLLRDVRAVQHVAEGVMALSAERGISEGLSWATILRGSAMAAQGCHGEGIALIQEGLAMFRAAGLVVRNSLGLLAGAYMEAGRFDDGLSALTEALTTVDQHEQLVAGPEIYRLKGELLLKQDQSNAPEAQRCFERAIAIARKQSAKSWELRATMSLARLLAMHGRRDEARAMLAEIYDWFTEGFDTADLKEAKALLAELS